MSEHANENGWRDPKRITMLAAGLAAFVASIGVGLESCGDESDSEDLDTISETRGFGGYRIYIEGIPYEQNPYTQWLERDDSECMVPSEESPHYCDRIWRHPPFRPPTVFDDSELTEPETDVYGDNSDRRVIP